MSVRRAASASAPGKSPAASTRSVKFCRLRRQRSIGLADDLVDPTLGLAELALAMLLELRAALVGGDRLVELALALLQSLHDLLELGERLLEAHRGDVRRQIRVGHDAPGWDRKAAGREAGGAAPATASSKPTYAPMSSTLSPPTHPHPPPRPRPARRRRSRLR